MLTLKAVIEEMGKETQVLKEEIQVLREKLTSRKVPPRLHIGEQGESTLVGMANIQLDYYPSACDDLALFAFDSLIPTGYYKIQTNASVSSQMYKLCKF